MEYFVVKCNRLLATKLDDESNTDFKQMTSVEEKMKYAIHERLKMNAPFLKTWPQAMKLQALPPNALESLKNVAELVDEICYACGDNTTDTKW